MLVLLYWHAAAVVNYISSSIFTIVNMFIVQATVRYKFHNRKKRNWDKLPKMQFSDKSENFKKACKVKKW